LVRLLAKVARAVERQCQQTGSLYRKDLPVIAVAALFEEHCRFDSGFQSKVYENIYELGTIRMNFLIKEVLKIDLSRWLEAIAAPYNQISSGNLRVYLSPSPEIDILAVFHIIFQSLRVRHVFSINNEISNNFSRKSHLSSSRKR
jgi:hypothetical protein